MRNSGLVLLVFIQAATFLGTLSLGKIGLMSGELAACVALVLWFVVGLPLSYTAVDLVARWQVTPQRESAKARILVSNVTRVDA